MTVFIVLMLLYFIIGEVDGYFEERNGKKYWQNTQRNIGK